VAALVDPAVAEVPRRCALAGGDEHRLARHAVQVGVERGQRVDQRIDVAVGKFEPADEAGVEVTHRAIVTPNAALAQRWFRHSRAP
jgi:hypothetical protein